LVLSAAAPAELPDERAKCDEWRVSNLSKRCHGVGAQPRCHLRDVQRHGFPTLAGVSRLFEEGMPETSPEYDNPPEGLYQPRRGFGMLWRSNAAVRDRVGWATMRDEMPYSVQVQTARDGSIYISTPFQGVFGLLPSGTGWNLFNTTPAINNAVFPTQVFVPLPTVFGN
jgi:hypothetical protein